MPQLTLIPLDSGIVRTVRLGYCEIRALESLNGQWKSLSDLAKEAEDPLSLIGAIYRLQRKGVPLRRRRTRRIVDQLRQRTGLRVEYSAGDVLIARQ